MPEALSSLMMGAMDWANRSAFRLFVAVPWPPRFRAQSARFSSPLREHKGHARGGLSVFFGLCQCIDEQQHAGRRYQQQHLLQARSAPLPTRRLTHTGAARRQKSQ